MLASVAEPKLTFGFCLHLNVKSVSNISTETFGLIFQNLRFGALLICISVHARPNWLKQSLFSIKNNDREQKSVDAGLINLPLEINED